MLLIDAHVHIYDCYDLAALFDSAIGNFRAQAFRMGRADNFSGILLLTERCGQHWFDKLSGGVPGDGNNPPGIGSWRVAEKPEDDCLVLAGETGEQLILIAGRQIVSSEGLEILGLAMAAEFEDGRPASLLIEQVKNAGGIPVIPWAFGKWSGARGKVLQQLVSRKTNPDFYLGDNGGRPSMMPCPGLLRMAGNMNWKILSGTDPLPIPGDETRVGTFGVYVEEELKPSAPASRIRALVKDGGRSFGQYGTLMNVLRFVKNQLALRGV